MLHLNDFILEKLSPENIKRLEKYINDTNIDEYIDTIEKKYNVSNIDTKKYDDFFEKHGLAKLNWGRNNSAREQFISLFSKSNKLSVLDAIIDNKGIVKIDSMPENGNIFELCKINSSEFHDEAKTIATWTNSGSANSGPCEMLLKFILKEGCTLKSGDVGIYISKDNTKEMEVKAATTGKNASGGHAAGQKGNNGQRIRGAWSIYLYLNSHLFNLDSSNSFADKSAYFQNSDGVKNFNKLIKDNGLDSDLDKVSNAIVDALCFQYNYITNEHDSRNTVPNQDDLKEAAQQYCKSIYNNGFDKQDLLNLVGCIQLYLYSKVEDFDYFFCVQVDKSNTSTNENNGNYWLVNNCKSSESALLDFDKVTENLYFGVLDSPTSTQGRTGKIYMKIHG